ncbi:uncharacterized protein BO88DRAFT_5109 [Aspergillus vadensis CBS 113365]|uniref:Uncharacterized protein n=1 Tax=Aspergillus vadensis (strain CBS 113365 / IMI 142717 / IBT 24658) TaxID=1448311 RepID=A0A319BLN5_ASPVC|nr:hypothetical protein BO88DRAFT_5109 [Aspergillus vadensis CBS 113365]PYH74206.1 hypothetical protein BO88DRAFT_5109 [Aspergillus vadensis CBS 113365]
MGGRQHRLRSNPELRTPSTEVDVPMHFLECFGGKRRDASPHGPTRSALLVWLLASLAALSASGRLSEGLPKFSLLTTVIQVHATSEGIPRVRDEEERKSRYNTHRG